MKHPTQDELLLFAYDELPTARVDGIVSHLAGCRACKDTVTQFDRGRTGLDFLTLAAHATPPTAARRGPTIAGATLALAAAAMLAAVAIIRSAPMHAPVEHWAQTTTWSSTAGYVTGGKAMVDIDAQLTRLEQEPRYGLPN